MCTTPDSLDSEDQSLWRMTKFLLQLPLATQGGFALSDSEKAEDLADNLETQFLPVTDPLVPPVIEMVDVAFRSYLLNPASEPHFTTPDEVHEAIRVLKVSKASDPYGIPNRAQKHLPKRAVSFFAHAFNAVLRTHHFPQAWKHA